MVFHCNVVCERSNTRAHAHIHTHTAPINEANQTVSQRGLNKVAQIGKIAAKSDLKNRTTVVYVGR